MSAAQTTYAWAWTLLDGLAQTGLTHLVLSPGSRSTPLILAAQAHPALTCHVVVDERAAAFFALGLARGSDMPVAVLSTSGTAPANWLGAVIEASHAAIPLILISADRPRRLVGTGANQTIDQSGLFTPFLRGFHALPEPGPDRGWLVHLAARAACQARHPVAGPVHINVPLPEPLVPHGPLPAIPSIPAPRISLPEPGLPDPLALIRVLKTGPGLIICGAAPLRQAAPAIAHLARRLNVPVLADPLSGLSQDMAPAHILTHPDALLRQDLPRPHWILRFGPPPLSKVVAGLSERLAPVPLLVVSDRPDWSDPSFGATHVALGDMGRIAQSLTAPPAPDSWTAWFTERDRMLVQRANILSDPATAPFEGQAARLLAARGLPLFLGNSLPVRAADWFMGRPAIPVFANRGASGIDGTLASFFGLSRALGPMLALVGDMSAQTDLGALALGRLCPGSVVVVADNGAGAIVDYLAEASRPELADIWTTPPLDLAQAAHAFGLPFHLAERTRQLPDLLDLARSAPTAMVIRLVIDRVHSQNRHRALYATE